MSLALQQPSRRAQGILEWAGALVLGVLLVILGLHAAGALLDMAAAIAHPYQLDPGEGAVWLQATRVPGPDMYRTGTGLPFIVDRYPPVYGVLTRAAGLFTPDLLSAGRLVSGLAALSIAPLVAGLVVTAGRRYGERLMARHLAIAAMAGLLALSLHTVRNGGLLMRVDTVGVAFALAGLLLAARANGRILGTTCALLLCTAALFTRQTEVSAGLAVVLVTLIRKPRKALIATSFAGGIGAAVLAVLEIVTGGGFLQHVIGYNVTRYGIQNLWLAVQAERSNAVLMAVMAIAALMLLLGLWRERAPGPRATALGQLGLIVRLLDPTMAARAVLLLHFGLSSLSLLALQKSGGTSNLIEWQCMGCVLIGVMLCDLLATRRRFVLVLLVVGCSVALQPYRYLPDRAAQAELDREAELVRLVQAAGKPVASEDVTLLMRAGRPVLYEPGAATELAASGRWDETPLVQMVRSQGFAFMFTSSNRAGGTERRSPAVDAAMRTAYPRVERVGPSLWLNLPR